MSQTKYPIANYQRPSLQKDERHSYDATVSLCSSCESDDCATNQDNDNAPRSVAAQVLFLNVIEELVVKPENVPLGGESTDDGDLPDDDAAMEGMFNEKFGVKTWWLEQAKQKHLKERAERRRIKKRQESMEVQGLLDLVSLVLA